MKLTIKINQYKIYVSFKRQIIHFKNFYYLIRQINHKLFVESRSKKFDSKRHKIDNPHENF